MALQTKTYCQGSFDRYSGTSNGYILDLILTEEAVDIAANTSRVSYTLQLRSGPSNRFDWELTASLSFGGSQLGAVTAEKFLDYNATWVLLTGQADVPHDPDGGGELSFTAVLTPYAGGNRYTPPALNLSGAMTLTPIARASALASTAAFIGDSALITLARKDPAYTHTLHYRFGALSGYLADATGRLSQTPVKLTDTAVVFPIPESFYHQIPDSPTGSCHLECVTYRGDTPIGQPQSATFTVTADPRRCGPVLSGTARDVNEATLAVTQDPSVLIKGLSSVLCTAQASARFGASVTDLWVNGVKATDGSVTLHQVQTATVTFRATDSRGYTTQFTVPGLSLADYTELSATATAWRTDPTDGTALLEVYGNFYPGTLGAAENRLTLRYRIGSGEWTAMTPEISGGSYRVRQSLSGLDYRQRFTLTVQIADKLQTLEKTVQLGRGEPVFHWGQEDFTFCVPVRFTAADGTVFTLDLENGQLKAIT